MGHHLWWPLGLIWCRGCLQAAWIQHQWWAKESRRVALILDYTFHEFYYKVIYGWSISVLSLLSCAMSWLCNITTGERLQLIVYFSTVASSDQDSVQCMLFLCTMPTGAIAAAGAYFGEGTGPILLGNVICNGDEKMITDCPNQRLAHNTCFHSEDASVICQRK